MNSPLPAVATLFAAFITACGGAPPSASKAEKHLERGEFARANEIADAELARYPKHPSLWHVKIKAALGQGDNRTAISTYEKWKTQREGIEDESALRTIATAVLWQGLNVPSPDIRVAAIQAIERLELERLGRDVTELIGSSDNVVAAAASIAVLRSHPQAPEVATAMLTSREPRARAIVIEGLGRKVGALARDDITRGLSDKDARVRRAAVGALAKIEEDADTDALVAAAGSDSDGRVRARALRALARGKRRQVVDVAARALEDDYLGAQLAAVEYLRTRAGDLGSGHLVKALASDNPIVGIRASVALFTLGKGDGREVLARALDAKSWTVRASAVNALAQAMPKNEALRLAGAALTDRRIQVRLAAARTLLALGSERMARSELTKALKDPDWHARLDAAIDLVRLGDKDAEALLASLAEHRDPKVRASAVPMQRVLKTPSRGLVRAMADDSARLRLQAAELVLEMLD